MQTFLPHKSFKKSAKVLDDKRLNKQITEGRQILDTLQKGDEAKGWKNHPAVLMWKGYESALKEYINTMLYEWVELRGKNYKHGYFDLPETFDYPDWIGSRKFHASHRSNLLRKDSEWYGKFGWKEPDNLEYVWPVRKTT